MYIIFSLASLLYIIKYTKEPIHNDLTDRQWLLIILSKLLKERRENDFINNMFVCSCWVFLIFYQQITCLYLLSYHI